MSKPDGVKTLFIPFICVGEAYVAEVRIVRETEKFWFVEPCAETGWAQKLDKGSSRYHTDRESAVKHLIESCERRLDRAREEVAIAEARLDAVKSKGCAPCQS